MPQADNHANPAQGGSYLRDPDTGALLPLDQTQPAQQSLERHAGDNQPAPATTQPEA